MSSPAEQQEERITLGLIQYLSRHTIDEDYSWVTRNAPGLGGRPARVAAVAVVAIFGLLVFTAGSQTTRNAVSEEKEREQLITQIKAKREAVDRRLELGVSLQGGNRRLQAGYLDGDSSSAGVTARLRRLSTLTGATVVKGPGVRVVVNDKAGATSDRDRVLDKDLQRLVNGLWAAGAEAISINGQRVTNLTTIREAGSAINVNYIPLRAPYTLLVVGDPKTLPSRFADTSSGAAWFDLVQQVGLRFDMRTAASLTLPSSDRLDLRYAVRAKGGTS
jgi:uncharacterized protein YlxW (UPF0749 family)